MSRAAVVRGSLRPISNGGRTTYRMFRWAGIAVLKPLWRLKVDGLDRLPVGVPYVLAPTHRSNGDFAALVGAIPRELRFMAKDSLWTFRPLGRFMEFNGSFPVDREHADRDALRRCEEAIHLGDPVVMFPEGRRKEGPDIVDLFDGPSFVACRTRVPIVPVAIAGSAEAMPRGAKLPHRGRVRVVIGEPIYPDVPTGGRLPLRAVGENTELLREQLQRMFDQVS